MPLLSLLYLSVCSAYAHEGNLADENECAAYVNDTLTVTVETEKWEYKTIYVHNTHPHARQGEVEFKIHKDADALNRYGREGWELVSVTPVVSEPIGNNRVGTQLLIYTFKRKLRK